MSGYMPTLGELQAFVEENCPGVTRRGPSPEGYDDVKPEGWRGSRAIMTHFNVVHDSRGWKEILRRTADVARS